MNKIQQTLFKSKITRMLDFPHGVKIEQCKFIVDDGCQVLRIKYISERTTLGLFRNADYDWASVYVGNMSCAQLLGVVLDRLRSRGDIKQSFS